MSAFKSLSTAMTKGFVRDKAALFFVFLMPLMFLVIFGLLFKDSGTDKIKIGVVGDGPVVQALQQISVVEVTKFGSLDEAVQKVKDGDIPASSPRTAAMCSSGSPPATRPSRGSSRAWCPGWWTRPISP
jgi:ABC-2 type transport system permease protein